MINVLLIEDKKHIRDGYVEFISSKRSSDYSIEGCDFSEFDERIVDPKFDIIVTDYKNENGDSDAGLEVVNKIKDRTFLPIVVYSGNTPSMIDDSISESETPFLKFIAKGDDFSDRLNDEINLIINSKEFKVKKDVEETLANSIDKNFKEYFWIVIQDHWADFASLNPDVLTRILSRKIIKDLHPQLLSGDAVDPIEFYEHPILDETKVESGSIISTTENENFLCINNDCDLIIRQDGLCKAKKIYLLKVEDIPSSWYANDRDQQKRHEKDLKMINNNSNKSEGRFFLPKTFFFQGGYVDFADITMRDIEIVNNKIKLDQIGKIGAKVHPPFIHRLISNFSNYYSRFGTPDIHHEL